jgi:hypothetical protein
VGGGLRDGLLAAGYVHGLFNARNFVAERYCKLLRSVAAIADLKVMEQLWTPSGYAVAGGLVVLGVAARAFAPSARKGRTVSAQLRCVRLPRLFCWACCLPIGSTSTTFGQSDLRRFARSP